jgi:ribosomal protein S12 methylthiotransferase accessory factor
LAADLATEKASSFSETAGGGEEDRVYSDRLCSAEETLARVTPLLGRHGITRVARQTGLDRLGIPVWNAIRPNSLSLAVNTGKGIGDADAKASAVMEALERSVAGEPEVACRLATPAGLAVQGAAFDRLDSLIGQGSQPFGDDETLAWIEGRDLIGERQIWVPRDAVALDRTRATRFWQSSDGLASGNVAAEAIFHGLLERIERDADLLWSLTRSAERAPRCVAADSFADPVIDGLAARIRDAGLLLQVFDMTSDIGVACFQALIGPADIGTRGGVLYAEAANGSGCHPVPVRAVIRAITEAAQSRLTLVSGSRDDIAPDVYKRPMPSSLIEDFGFAPLAQTWPARAVRPMPEMLQAVVAALRQRGIKLAIAVPLNPDEPAFSVAKVLVPGLENPPGPRRTRFGSRALARMMRSR